MSKHGDAVSIIHTASWQRHAQSLRATSTLSKLQHAAWKFARLWRSLQNNNGLPQTRYRCQGNVKAGHNGMSGSMMELQGSVLAELEWDPVVRQAQIDVNVTDAMVTLTGCVSCDAIRRAAEDATRRVRGVKAVVNCIDVIRPLTNQPTDAELARIAALCLQSTVSLPAEGLQVTVQDGLVSLTGTVPWRQQRLLAEQIVSQLRGVAGVTNLITVDPPELAEDAGRRVELALCRSGGLDAQWITVEAYKGKVVLRGSVRSWQEHYQAELTASRVPGVVDVTNYLAVLP